MKQRILQIKEGARSGVLSPFVSLRRHSLRRHSPVACAYINNQLFESINFSFSTTSTSQQPLGSSIHITISTNHNTALILVTTATPLDRFRCSGNLLFLLDNISCGRREFDLQVATGVSAVTHLVQISITSRVSARYVQLTYQLQPKTLLTSSWSEIEHSWIVSAS